jgi:hypothetical protein
MANPKKKKKHLCMNHGMGMGNGRRSIRGGETAGTGIKRERKEPEAMRKKIDVKKDRGEKMVIEWGKCKWP